MKKLIDVLINPPILLNLTLENLSLIIAEARYFNMLSQLKYLCEQHKLLPLLPIQCQKHFDSAWLFYANQSRKLEKEVTEIEKVLKPLAIDWMYLKGCAYHLTGMRCFTGRMMSDIDLLVSEKDLSKVENALKASGFIQKKMTNYDEKFYRNWAQEIPPVKHLFRQVDLDVHFNILPKTIKEALDGKFLFEQSAAIGIKPYEKALKPHAMLVHSAIHLFHESEYHKGLRDLYDIVLFIKEFGDDEIFWQETMTLQNNIGNQQSLYLALRYCTKIYHLPIPQKVMQHYEKYKPSTLILKLLDFSFISVFTSTYPSHRKFGYRFACYFLYLRGHLKRMPIRLLIPHLTRKSVYKFRAKEESQSFI